MTKEGESQKREDAGARKGRKVAIHFVFPMVWGSGGSKSNLAKAAGAEPGRKTWLPWGSSFLMKSPRRPTNPKSDMLVASEPIEERRCSWSIPKFHKRHSYARKQIKRKNSCLAGWEEAS